MSQPIEISAVYLLGLQNTTVDFLNSVSIMTTRGRWTMQYFRRFLLSGAHQRWICTWHHPTWSPKGSAWEEGTGASCWEMLSLPQALDITVSLSPISVLQVPEQERLVVTLIAPSWPKTGMVPRSGYSVSTTDFLPSSDSRPSHLGIWSHYSPQPLITPSQGLAPRWLSLSSTAQE